MLRTLDFNGNPYIGVFCRSCEDLTIVPSTLTRGQEMLINETLGTDIIKTTIGGTNIVGVLVAMNSMGVVTADFASEEELLHIKDKSVLRIPDIHNAAGNNILVNDRAALVNPDMDKKTIRALEDVFGVEVTKGTIGKLKTVGTAAVATNKGLICHPEINEHEIKHLKDLFKLPIYIGTANYGTPLLGACMIANTKGAVVGNTTTGIEMNRIEEALDIF